MIRWRVYCVFVGWQMSRAHGDQFCSWRIFLLLDSGLGYLRSGRVPQKLPYKWLLSYIRECSHTRLTEVRWPFNVINIAEIGNKLICYLWQVRQFLCDFAVLISIIVFTLFDALYRLDTPKLMVPSEIKVCATQWLCYTDISATIRYQTIIFFSFILWIKI